MTTKQQDAPAPATVPTVAPTEEQQAIALQMQELRAAFELQAQELARLKAQQPRIARRPSHVKRAERSYTPPEVLQHQAMRGLARDQQTEGNMRWYDTPQGRGTLPPEYRPLFQPGDIVRLNPDTCIWGTATRWGSALESQGLDGVGEVMCCMGLTQSFEPKYKVRIPGITRGDGNGSGFRESELLFAE